MDKFNEYGVLNLSIQEMRDVNGGGRIKGTIMNVINTIKWFKRKIIKKIF